MLIALVESDFTIGEERLYELTIERDDVWIDLAPSTLFHVHLDLLNIRAAPIAHLLMVIFGKPLQVHLPQLGGDALIVRYELIDLHDESAALVRSLWTE